MWYPVEGVEVVDYVQPKRHHQQCLRRPLSGPELNVVSGRGG